MEQSSRQNGSRQNGSRRNGSKTVKHRVHVQHLHCQHMTPKWVAIVYVSIQNVQNKDEEVVLPFLHLVSTECIHFHAYPPTGSFLCNCDNWGKHE